MIGTFDMYKQHTSLILQGVSSSDLKGQIGNGLKTFETAVGKMDRLSEKSPKMIGTVVQQLKEVNKLKQSKNDLAQLAFAFKTYLGNLFKQVEEDSNIKSAQLKQQDDVKNLVTQVKNTITNVVNQLTRTSAQSSLDLRKDGNGVGKYIDDAWKTLTSLSVTMSAIPRTSPVAKVLCIAVFNGAKGLLTQLMLCYQSSYQGTTTNELTTPKSPQAAICAKIFLSCLPLIFSNLQQLYWKCKHDNAKGGWSTQQLNGSGGQGTDLKHLMDLMTFSSVRLNGAMTGDNIVSNAFKDFNEFTNAASAQSYAEFLKRFKSTGIEKWKADNPTAQNENYLSGLYLCSSWYFQGCQAKLTQTRPPSSIREMLYWLSGLQFAPRYNDLENQITSIVRSDFNVAISGSPKSNEQLTSDQVTEYLVMTCLHAQTVFSSIQAPRISNHPEEPWLHSLYSNSEFNFTYPSSGTALLYTLSNYVYALQFQFQFLYKQCEFDYENGCGWWLCKFGSSVLPKNDTTVSSSFCGSVEVASGKHNGDKCGIQTQNPSPLQAFLTDKLKGFRRDPADPYSHLAECASGSMCHVPMGFKVNDLRGLATGGHLMMALNFFCGKSNTPLPKLCHTLSCVTKRTPMTLSDVFGFTFHLTGQMFRDARAKDSDPTSDVNSALESLLKKVPNTIKALFSDVTSDLEKMGSRFFDLSLHCHRKNGIKTVQRNSAENYRKHHNSNKARDLMSLYDSECKDKTCGKYLEPLAVSSGATFANDFASTYLTWALYLTDDIYESFQGFLDRFNSLKCTGCQNTPPCDSHNPGEHSSQCQCPSIVQCADALTVLYEYGFHFQDAFWLKGRNYTGGKWHDNSNKRSCANFHSQLQSVINGNPLTQLLASIDELVYLFRKYFLYNQSAFWTIYIGLILYTFFFLLDTLRVRSHLHFPSSNSIPPVSLLTTGRAPALTKFTKLTYFMP
ncbi:variant erythrocyte surface antigen-1 family protein [Babesia caballi]|uniref:Variant erythrocyte surface antigen-1 family protein n=1 Tax=Babesia caballi TaxID=5871 RepID=A0AAV4LST0_BABCB|nr:variant erythrocyte surface antigen-1 family protein [Babesia caballi]